MPLLITVLLMAPSSIFKFTSGNTSMHVDQTSQGVIGDTWLSYGKVTGVNILTLKNTEYMIKSHDYFTIPKGTPHSVHGQGTREYLAIDSVTGLGVGAGPTTCDKGEYIVVSEMDVVCTPCQVGKYQDAENVFIGLGGIDYSCKNCPSETYQDEEGQSSCKNCTSGTYQDEEGQSSCKNCTSGTYQNEEGQASCKNVQDSDDDPTLSTGAIVGIAVGSSVFLLLIGYIVYRRLQSPGAKQNGTPVGSLIF